MDPFGWLVEQVLTSEPYAFARTVTRSSIRAPADAGNTSVKRTQDRWANARLAHLPVHAPA